MTMARILVLFASSYGHTRDIAWTIERHLRRRGHAVDLVDARQAAPSPGEYDLVVVGSPVQMGRHARSIRRWAQRNRAELDRQPAAFFSVSMSAAGGKPDPYVARFMEETGWHPGRVVSFAGALPYTRYNPLLRFVMKRISRKGGHTTDTSRDHDFTDWKAVRAFAQAIADGADRTAAASRADSPPAPWRTRRSVPTTVPSGSEPGRSFTAT